MNDPFYERFQKRWNEITDLPPQTVGPFTPYYKMITKRLKVMPFPILVLLSAGIIIALFVVFGSGITFITTVLQRGF